MDPVAKWKRGVKSRLLDVARSPEGGGSQRRLAGKWLGSLKRSPQVSDWCNDEKDLPNAYSLHLLRAKCGTDLNWLLNGPDVEGERDDWPAKRRAALGRELGEYALHVMNEHIYRKRLAFRGLSRQALAYRAALQPGSLVLGEVRGDFLRHFRAEVERLTDQAGERARLVADSLDAEQYRRECRAAFLRERVEARRTRRRLPAQT